MKTVLYDLFSAQPTTTSKFHGGGETIKKVFQELINKYIDVVRLIVFYDKNKYLDDWVTGLIECNRIRSYDVKRYEDIRQIFFRERIDIIYSGIPYYYKREWIPKDVTFVGTVHGLRLLELPAEKYAYMYVNGLKSLKERLKYSAREICKKKHKIYLGELLQSLDYIITDSYHSAYSIKYHFPECNNKHIRVLYPPLKKTDRNLDESLINSPYVLLMGGDRHEKNIYREICSIENLINKGYLKEYRFVIIGKVSKKIINIIDDESRYVIKDYVSAAELENLYKYCTVFYYASLNEGFGIPPLEAMRYGVTCLVSGVCSLPEVYKNGVYYTNPYDIDEMGIHLLYAINNPIDKQIVKAQFDSVVKRQEDDLKEICQLIVQQVDDDTNLR
jgi:glycosyltransferase involved in cell wall biosynthesis